MRLICFTLVFAASMRALLTAVAVSTSIAGHKVSMVCHSRHVSSMYEATTRQPKIVFSVASLVDRGHSQQAPHLHLTPPRSGEFLDGDVGGEDEVDAGLGQGGEVRSRGAAVDLPMVDQPAGLGVVRGRAPAAVGPSPGSR